MINKILIGAGAVCFLAFITLLSGLFYVNNKLSTQLAEYKERLSEADTLMDYQNKAIAQQEIDMTNYLKNEAERADKIEIRYKYIPTADSQCEAQLEAINQAINVFYLREDKTNTQSKTQLQKQKQNEPKG